MVPGSLINDVDELLDEFVDDRLAVLIGLKGVIEEDMGLEFVVIRVNYLKKKCSAPAPVKYRQRNLLLHNDSGFQYAALPRFYGCGGKKPENGFLSLYP